MNQTAVEWLVQKLREQKFVTESQIFIAKKMEKEHMEELKDFDTWKAWKNNTTIKHINHENI